MFLAQIGGPAVGGGDGGIQFRVCVRKPCGVIVVKVRERALRELGGALGVARFKARIAHGADSSCVGIRHEAAPRAIGGTGKFERARCRPFRRVKPVFAQCIQFLRGGGDGLAMFCGRSRRRVFAKDIALIVVIVRRAESRDGLQRVLCRVVGEGERKSFKARRWRIAKAALAFAHLRAVHPRPRLVKARVQHAEKIIVGARENINAVVGKHDGIRPRKDAELGNTRRREKAKMPVQGDAHSGARFGVKPPIRATMLALVLVSFRFHAIQNVLVRQFVEREGVQFQIRAGVYDPSRRHSLHNRAAVEPRFEKVGVWSAVRIRRGEPFARERVGNIKATAFLGAAESNVLVRAQPRSRRYVGMGGEV